MKRTGWIVIGALALLLAGFLLGRAFGGGWSPGSTAPAVWMQRGWFPERDGLSEDGFLDGQFYGHWRGHMGAWGGWGLPFLWLPFMLMGGLFRLIIPIAVIYLLIRAIRGSGKKSEPPPPAQPAETV